MIGYRTDTQTTVATITIDQHGIVISCDPVAENLFGYRRDEIVGTNISGLMPEPFRSEHDGYLSRYLQQGHPRIIGKGREVLGQRKDGSLFPMWLAVSQVDIGEARVFVGSIVDLSGTRAMEKRLQLSQETTRAILETAASPIITIDRRGSIASFNPAAVKLFGYAAEDVIGRNVSMLMPEPYRSQHDGYMARYLGGGAPHIIGSGREVSGCRKDGSIFPMHLSVGEMQLAGETCFVGIVTDITLQKEHEYELKRHRDQLDELVTIASAEINAIVTTALSGIIAIKQDSRIQIFNPAAEKLFGWSRDEVVGKDVSILMAEPDVSMHNEYVARFVTSRESHIIGTGREVTAKRKDGSVFPAYLAVGHTQLTGGQDYFVGFISDITQQKEHEAELIRARDAAEAGERAKSSFVANMSHEIRTPMNAIIGFAEVVLQDKTLLPSTAKHAEIILGSARSLLGIINDILDVSKMESGKFTLETICFHLPNALTNVLHTVEHQANEKGLEVFFEYDVNLGSTFMGDPTRLRQVVLNLVGNAVKFTDQGSVTLSVRQADDADMLEFTVADTGIGMTKVQMERVFEPFSQADVSMTRRFGGTGLGTTISKQIVESMGGRIWVTSEPGKGSVFHFSVRMPATLAVQGCLYDEAPSAFEEYVSPRLFHILLAEDIEVNAKLASLRLEQQGHIVRWVKNGREVVAECEANDYDLILMDVMMPEMDGLEATCAIRQMEQDSGKHVAILALTASIMRDDYIKCIEAGMDAVEGKPINFPKLFATMESLVPAGLGQRHVNRTICVKEQHEANFAPVAGIVDHVRALRAWRVQESLIKALCSFAHERSKDAQKIEQLLREHAHDEEPARGLAHALKGLAGNLCIQRVADLASQIDAHLKHGERQAVVGLLAELDSALQQAALAIAALETPATVDHGPGKEISADLLLALFARLLAALDELNPDAVEPVLASLADYVEARDLAPIQRCVDGFDFDAAKENVKALAEKLKLE